MEYLLKITLKGNRKGGKQILSFSLSFLIATWNETEREE